MNDPLDEFKRRRQADPSHQEWLALIQRQKAGIDPIEPGLDADGVRGLFRCATWLDGLRCEKPARHKGAHGAGVHSWTRGDRGVSP